MADIFEEFKFKVRAYECAPDGMVTVANIANYLQESASVNAEHLGFNKSDFDAQGMNITWVMTRMRIKCDRRPRWNEEISVLTYPRNARRIIAHRDFVLDGIGAATTEWMMIDMTTRRPVSIPDFVTAKGNDVRDPVLGTDPFSRFKFDQAPECTLDISARPSDIDLNGHVNNARYIAWLFDAWGNEPEGAFDFELVFKNEMRLGEQGRIVVGGNVAAICGVDGSEKVLARIV